MIIDENEQGSEGWFRARIGVPSASNFGKIMTPTLGPSTQSEVYQNRLVAEWYTGTPEETFISDAMRRGTELEPIAREAYEFATDREVEEVGFVYMNEEKLAGCSPDGLCDDMGIEIKCPLPSTHVSYLLSGGLPTAYKGQVQGSMYVTGFETWDFVSYCPGFPPLIITVERDEKFMKAFEPLMAKFIDGMMAKREKLIQLLGDRAA